MRVSFGPALAVAIVVSAVGCNSHKEFDGPTVDAFTGRLTHDGKPVAFPADERVLLELFHEKAQSFKIPIEPDGTFKIGWMPIGKYSATLIRERPGAKGGVPARHPVPNGLTIEAGQTEYTIELGKGFKV
jgi:hypothetical protein